MIQGWGESLMHPSEQRKRKDAVSGSHLWSDPTIGAGDWLTDERRLRARRPAGFIDRVFDMVQNVLRKHQISGQSDSGRDSGGD
jgi:hypothetical protein